MLTTRANTSPAIKPYKIGLHDDGHPWLYTQLTNILILIKSYKIISPPKNLNTKVSRDLSDY